MAELVTKLQRIKQGVISPRARYSRVISCGGTIKAPAVEGFGHTEAFGARVWLLGVRVRFDPHLWAANHQVRFYILRGQGVPHSAAAILTWQNIIPCTLWGQANMAWVRTQTFGDYEWSMEQLFEGEANRFGFWFGVSPGMAVQDIRVSFEVSEG